MSRNIKKTAVMLLSLLSLTEPVLAGDVKTCEISMVPKASAVIENTFRNKPKLAEKFISVLLEDYNLFLGPALLGYFDQTLVKHGYIKAEGGLSFTALNSAKFAKENKKNLEKFGSTSRIEQFRIANEIWQRLQIDLELDKPDIINGKNVFVRFREKGEADAIKGSFLNNLSEVRFKPDLLDERVAQLVELRSALIEITNQPGGGELIRSFIVNSLPFHARILGDLQVRNADVEVGVLKAIFGSVGLFGLAIGGGIELLPTLGPTLAAASAATGWFGGTSGLVYHIFKSETVADVTWGNTTSKQCEACSLLAKGVRKELERKGLTLNASIPANGPLEVRSLGLSKPPMLSHKDHAAEDHIELPHPLQLNDVNNFGQTLFSAARELLSEVETIETSYESGIRYVISGKNLGAKSLRQRFEFRFGDIQTIQSYLQGMIEQAEKTGGQLTAALSYVKENVDTHTHQDQHMNSNVSSAMKAQVNTLELAENALVMARQKLISLSSGIIRESNLINEIFLRMSDKAEDPNLLTEYFSFIAERQDPNVDELMNVLQSTTEPETKNNESKVQVEVPEIRKFTDLSEETVTGIEQIQMQKNDFISSSMNLTYKVLGRKINKKYLENIIYESRRNNLSLHDALLWFKDLDDLGGQSVFRSSINDDHLIRLLPLLPVRDLKPNQIIARFFGIDLLGSNSRPGWTIYDSAVAPLVVASFQRDIEPEELVGRFFEFVKLMKDDHSGFSMKDNDYSGITLLSFDFPNISPKDLLNLEIEFYQAGKVGISKIDDREVIKMMRMLLAANKGQLPDKAQILALTQEFYSLHERFKSTGISDALVVELMSLARSYPKYADSIGDIFESINMHTKNKVTFSLDILEVLLNKAAVQKTQPSKESKDILEAMFILANRGHKMLPDEFSKNK